MKTDYIEQIKACYYKNGNSIKAIPMKHYMRDQFEFIGIPTPQRRKISRPFLGKDMLPSLDELDKITVELWQLEGREFQYFGQELVMKYNKMMIKGFIRTIEFMILNKSWWDTIDAIAKNIVGNYMNKFPDMRNELINAWLKSENIWLQRSCLLFQLGYKENTDAELLFFVINELKKRDEFFIQKAIGWSLREYSKSNPQRVTDFVAKVDLSPLAYKEGMKHLKKIT